MSFRSLASVSQLTFDLSVLMDLWPLCPCVSFSNFGLCALKIFDLNYAVLDLWLLCPYVSFWTFGFYVLRIFGFFSFLFFLLLYPARPFASMSCWTFGFYILIDLWLLYPDNYTFFFSILMGPWHMYYNGPMASISEWALPLCPNEPLAFIS